MNKKLFIVAGTIPEYAHWLQDNWDRIQQMGITRRQDVVFVSGPDTFRGCANIHGFFIGSFRERSDIKQICDMICICNNLSYQHKFYD